MKKQTAIIFDPVCGTSKGHNFRTMIKYAEWLKHSLFIESQLWIPDSDCESTNKDLIVKKNIPWVYEYFLPVENKSLFSFSQHLLRSTKGKYRTKIVRAPTFILSSVTHIIAQKKIETALLKSFKEKTNFLFFPGADLYSILALASLSERKLIPKNLNIIIRLMGVMETAGYFPKSKSALFSALRLILKNHSKVKVTAETEKYATVLAKHLKVVVKVTHIPNDSSHCLPEGVFQDKSIQNIVCLGGARSDKGYFELIDFINHARKIFGRHVKFYIQTMSSTNKEYNPQYEMKLAKTLNAILLPSFLSDEDLFGYLFAADVIFLPYSSGTYELRGSAILFDSLGTGKPILGRSNTGFGLTIDIAGLGCTFSDINDFGTALSKLTNLTSIQKDHLYQCQNSYLNKMNENLKEIFDGQNFVRFY